MTSTAGGGDPGPATTLAELTGTIVDPVAGQDSAGIDRDAGIGSPATDEAAGDPSDASTSAPALASAVLAGSRTQQPAPASKLDAAAVDRLRGGAASADAALSPDRGPALDAIRGPDPSADLPTVSWSLGPCPWAAIPTPPPGADARAAPAITGASRIGAEPSDGGDRQSDPADLSARTRGLGGGSAAAPTTTSVPAFDHIVLVMEENRSYSEIIGNADAAYLNGVLIAGGASLSNYFPVGHPSQPNYLTLYAGSTFGITDDNAYSFPDPSLFTVLNSAGKTFTGYVESPAKPAHDPWESFPEGFTVESDFSNFPTSDFSSLPAISFVIPNLNDDMHDGTVATADGWLQQHLGAYAQWAVTHNSLLVVTWDETDNPNDARVPAILYGASVVPGTYNTAYTHYNMLPTMLAGYGLAAPRLSGAAAPIEVFGGVTPCYCRGTLILTNRGPVPVEALARGDRVVTLSGALQPIKWIGRRAYAGRFIAGNREILPVRIAAAALADQVPSRDLWLSPEHALYIDGFLVAVRLLINGVTITQAGAVDRVDYFHIELAAHDVLLAEGAAAESYVDCDNRSAFHNAGEFARLYGDRERSAARFCAPRLADNAPQLTAIRAGLAARAQRTAAAGDRPKAPDMQRRASC